MALLKKIWKNNSKHKKLCEDWSSNKGLGSELSLTATTEVSERKFRLKYVGVVPAERACSAPATAAAIATAVSQAKGKRKLQRVDVTVSPKGIVVEDAVTFEKLLDVSIYRISYCSADAAHSQIFAFIASDANELFECHAFLCPKRKLAKDASLAAAKSFTTAYQIWQANQEKKPFIRAEKPKKKELNVNNNQSSLIDFSTDEQQITTDWVSFEDDKGWNAWEDAPATHLLNSTIY